MIFFTQKRYSLFVDFLKFVSFNKPVSTVIVLIVPVVSKNVQTIGTMIWKRYQTIANSPDD